MTQEKTNEVAQQNHKSFPFRVSSRKYLYIIGIFSLIGVGGGLAYHYFIGCRSGACAITSSPYLSMVWGGLLGFLMTDFFVKKVPQS